jgi:hypothetical protein
MDIATGTFARPGGASETLPPQLPEGFARFILPAKVSNENTCVHPSVLVRM